MRYALLHELYLLSALNDRCGKVRETARSAYRALWEIIFSAQYLRLIVS